MKDVNKNNRKFKRITKPKTDEAISMKMLQYSLASFIFCYSSIVN